MVLKDVLRSLTGKKNVQENVEKPSEAKAFLTGADFPMIPASDVDLSKYHKIPLVGLASLGTAFSTLPEAARTITKAVTTQVDIGTPVFAGLWPDGVFGRMIDKGFGFSGNITGLVVLPSSHEKFHSIHPCLLDC